MDFFFVGKKILSIPKKVSGPRIEDILRVLNFFLIKLFWYNHSFYSFFLFMKILFFFYNFIISERANDKEFPKIQSSRFTICYFLRWCSWKNLYKGVGKFCGSFETKQRRVQESSLPLDGYVSCFFVFESPMGLSRRR